MIGLLVACWHWLPFRYHRLVVSQPLQVVYKVLQSKHLVSLQATTVPSTVLGPNPDGIIVLRVACWHWLPFRNHPPAVLQVMQVAIVFEQLLQLATEQMRTFPTAVLGPNPVGKTGDLQACWQTLPLRYQPFAVSQTVQVV